MSRTMEAGLASPVRKSPLTVNTQILQDKARLSVPDIPGSPINTRSPTSECHSPVLCHSPASFTTADSLGWRSFVTAQEFGPGAFPAEIERRETPSIIVDSSLVDDDEDMPPLVESVRSPRDDLVVFAAKHADISMWMDKADLMESGGQTPRWADFGIEDEEPKPKEPKKAAVREDMSFEEVQAVLEGGIVAGEDYVGEVPGAWKD